ncbi:hypothetical protein FRC03_009666 [Tulasnella sp. 419]|nr:hypothetical protein FRC03_009666 [Tulasnella sp. 419]
MDQCRTEAKEARQRWDRGLADHLYLEANAHKEKMLQWNKEACDLIFKENNRGRKPGVIDLHGLHVHEAIERTKDAVEAAVARQDPDIKLIVGKGNHSQDSVAKVKPGIEKWLSENGFTASLDRHGGMFIVVLGDQGSKTQLVEADLTQMSPSPMSEGDCDEYF